MKTLFTQSRGAAIAMLLSLLSANQAFAQDPLAVGTVLGGTGRTNTNEPYVATDSYLDDLVAPIALYPDDLLALVLPAARFPGQIAEAARFLEDLEFNPNLAPYPDWDDAILALLNYPDVIHLLAADIDWTRRLGEAVAVRQAAVMVAAQHVRTRAYAAGNLASDTYQQVERTRSGIVIRPANPTVIYVPRYEPARIFVRHNRPVIAYYPRPYPVYYYPYPDGYAFGTDFFWGLSSYFSIGWSTFSLGLVFNDSIGHPYYGSSYRYTTFDRPYRYPVQRRTVTVHVFDRRDGRDRRDDRDWDRNRDWDRDRDRDDDRDRDRDDDRDRDRDRNDNRDRRDGDRHGTDADRFGDPDRDNGARFDRAWRNFDERDTAGMRLPPIDQTERSRERALPTTRIETRTPRDVEQRMREQDQRDRDPDRRATPRANAASVRTFEARDSEVRAEQPDRRARRQAGTDVEGNRVRELRQNVPPPAAPAVVPAPAAGERSPGQVNRAWRDVTRREAAPKAGEPPAYRAPVPQPEGAPQDEAAAEDSGNEGGGQPRRRGRGVTGD